MHVLLAGANGRLGSLILTTLKEKKVSYCALNRNTLSTPDQLINFLVQDLIILDVTLPEGTYNLCQSLLSLPPERLSCIRGIIVGTTGHTLVHTDALTRLSKLVPLCIVPNFSKGIFLFKEILTAKTSSGLTVTEIAKKLGFDLAIHEVHHVNKVDAPSGTAVSLCSKASIDPARVSSTRVGAVTGEHTLWLSSALETLRISHAAHSRQLFADCAVELCFGIYRKQPAPGFLKHEMFLSDI